MDLRDQIILPRRAIPQPVPHIAPAGDCVACCIGGLLDISVQAATELDLREPEEDPRSPVGVHAFLSRLVRDGELEHVVLDAPSWPSVWPKADPPWGRCAWYQALPWWNYARALMAGGYYGIAYVNHAQKGPLEETDHMVLFVGARSYVEKHPKIDDAGTYRHEILVSCSSKKTPAEEWVRVRDLLTFRGGFNACWAKLSAKKEK